MTVSHTRGPWRAGPQVLSDDVRPRETYTVAFTPDAYGHELDVDVRLARREANARLIAAAPDLLLACELIRACMRRPDFTTSKEIFDSVESTLDDVIAKARGRR